MKMMYRLILLLVITFVSQPGFCYSADRYKGFARIDPNTCVKAGPAVMSQLPEQWQQYKGFVKICNLRKSKSPAEVSIISIWTEEYLKNKYPPPAIPQWEQFPLPLIVDKKLHKIGSLPEAFPENDVTSPVIYYGRWHDSIPTEIRVDVENPAVGGDYYYPPIVFNDKAGTYELSKKEIKHGNRN